MVDTLMTAARPLAGGWYAKTSDMLTGDVRTPRDGHATFVAGLILSEAPGATVEIRAALDENGKSDSWGAGHAIVEAARSGAHILNLSFSCITGDGQPPLALSTAIDLLDSDVVVVAAAGNHADSPPHEPVTIDGHTITSLSKCVAYPAALDNVIAVGSVADSDANSSYSPKGPWVDIRMVGEKVTSTFPRYKRINGFAEWSGTSFAAARVSGAIAAQTVPGSISARQAWEEMLSTAQKRITPGQSNKGGGLATGVTAGPPSNGDPPILRSRPWWT